MSKNIRLLVYLVSILLFCLFPAYAFTGAWSGAVLWATAVMPALFPFFVMSSLLQSTGVFNIAGRYMEPVMQKLFRLPGVCGGVAVLSMLSGSPSGARMSKKLYEDGLITPVQSQRLAAMTTNCGPSFMLGTIGVALLSDPRAGLCVLIAHYLSAVANGLLFRFYGGRGRGARAERSVSAKPRALPLTIGEAVSDSAMAILTVGGFVTLFSALTATLRAVLSPLMIAHIPGVNALMCAIMEMVSGCAATAAIDVPMRLKTALVCGAVSFGGLSVWAQSMAFLRKAGVKMGVLALSKLTHALLAICICYLIMPSVAIPAWISASTESVSGGITMGHVTAVIIGFSIFSCAVCCLWALWCKKHGFPQVNVPYSAFLGNPIFPYSPIYYPQYNEQSQTKSEV